MHGRGLPAFSIYGAEVQDKDDTTITADGKKIFRLCRAAVAVGVMKNKSYVNIGCGIYMVLQAVL